jgi:hypothetical protein
MVLLAALMTSVFWIDSIPASASCDPRKPQTCVTCHPAAIGTDESGNVVIEWTCH